MDNKILGLRTTIYKVSDLAKAKQWYSQAFECEPYFDEPFYVGFDIQGYELGLQPEENPLSKSDAVVSYWGTNAIDDEFQRFLSLGATEHEAPQKVGDEIVVGSVKDPWDNVIGLIYNPLFKMH